MNSNTRTWHRNAALILPLLLVNSAALFGQTGWAHDHISTIWALDVLFAASVESIGVYLAAEAHAALMAGDASIRLRLGSYLVGMLVGTLNYAHFADAGYTPNPVAITFGLLSSISPLLWAIRSRSLNRDRLRELGQVDPRAVRFSILRWAMFPVRTFKAFRNAVWFGIVQPAEAVAAIDARQTKRTAATEPVKARRTRSPREKVEAAARQLPNATVGQIAKIAGVSADTARRYLGTAPTSPAPATYAAAQ